MCIPQETHFKIKHFFANNQSFGLLFIPYGAAKSRFNAVCGREFHPTDCACDPSKAG